MGIPTLATSTIPKQEVSDMQRLLSSLIVLGAVFGVQVGAEPMVAGQVRLASGEPVAGAHVRLFDLRDLRSWVGTTTDESGSFALPLGALPGAAVQPTQFHLGENYPNPFNPSTIIPYRLPRSMSVRLEVFNVLGQHIATLVDGQQSSGSHTARWDGTDAAGAAVAAGIYLYRLSGEGVQATRSMVLIDGQAGIPAGSSGRMPQAGVEATAVASVYGLTVSGPGLMPFVDPAFRVAAGPVDLVVEASAGMARAKAASSGTCFSGGVLGDVDNNGRVDFFDALLVALYSRGSSTVMPNNGDISLGDVNADGRIDFTDAYLIAAWLNDPSDPTLPAGIGEGGGGASPDCAALMALYEDMGGDNWEDNANWLSDAPLGEWFGVTTDVDGRVTSLELDGNGLSGGLPPELGDLTNLRVLDLYDNELSGSLPESLGNLANLVSLYLDRNPLSGSLPLSLVELANLEDLNLRNTQLCAPLDAGFQAWLEGIENKRGVVNCEEDEGDEPDDRAALVALYEATDGDNWTDNTNWLSDRPLGEWFGVTVDNEGQITELSLVNNNLRGVIPPELGSLTELRVLDLSNNRLVDPILDSFLKLERLEQFYFSGNNGLCAPDTDAFTSWLVGVQFDGPSCAQARDRAVLVALYNSTGGANWSNSQNWLTDAPLDQWHGVTVDNEGRVTALRLPQNNLSGPIPAALAALASLGTLALHQNNLTGPIPPELGNLASLGDLNLWGNRLSGSIPPELGNLASLWQLALSSNDLSGSIPPELGNLGDALVVLDLQSNNLTGSIPPELGNLARLQSLYLSSNDLTGPIPTWLGDLANLEALNLGGNALTGSIPTEIANLARLQSLDLSRNDLMGPIPTWLGDLANLESLNLSENEFTGILPPEIGGLSRLKHLRLSGNALTGSIPSSMMALKGIVTLSFQNTELCISISSWLASIPNVESSGKTCTPTERDILVALYNLTGGSRWLNKDNWLTDEPIHLWAGVNTDSDGRVDYIDLSDNGLRGAIPPELGQMPNLIVLNLSGNQLRGTIPAGLAQAPSLRDLYLSGNQLEGPIPAEIGSFPKLQLLDLSGNFLLKGPIPAEIGNLAELRSLDISRSFVTGALPPEIGNLDKLFSLRLHTTQLAGALPATLTALNLTEFHFRNTQLCVTPPVQLWFDSLPLQRIRPHNYSASGLTCPASDRDILVALYNATGGPGWSNNTGWLTDAPLDDWYGVRTDSDGRITSLSLHRNLLTGEIPPSLWTLPNLVNLALTENGNLTGTIPPEIGNLKNLLYLDLSDTGLRGAIPPEIGNLSNLITLNLTNVPRLSGPIPPEIGNLRNLSFLNLNFNTGLNGQIPPEIGNLAELITLDLQHLGLTGTIPPEIGNLPWLRRLDLSNTKLTGTIPSEMGNLVNLKYLDLSNTSMWGSIPLAMTALQRLNTFDFSDTYICVNHILEHRRLILPWLQSIPVPYATASKRSANNILLAQGLHKIEEGNRSSALAPVPLIARDSTMLRVFVANDLRDGQEYPWPEARARFYNPGNPSPVYSVRLVRGSLPEGTSGGILPDPSTVSELSSNLVGDLEMSLNGWVPGWVMWPGVEMEVEIDPEGKGHPRFRDRVRAAVPLVSVEPVTVTVVPFIWRAEPDKYGSLPGIRSITEEPLLSQEYGFTRDVLPISDPLFTVRVREPLWTDVEPNTDINNASKLLLELELAWILDSGRLRWLRGKNPAAGIERDPWDSGSSGLNFYQGWIFPSGAFGPESGELGGLARLNGWVSVSIRDPLVRAHELGHNFGLRHAPAPCSEFLYNVDLNYPDPTGKIDAWGYGEPKAGMVRVPVGMIDPSETFDFMSYCPPSWTSEYHFRKALSRTGAEAMAAGVLTRNTAASFNFSGTSSEPKIATSVLAQSTAARESVLLWGGVDVQGSLTLDPSFYLDLPPRLPQAGGPYHLVGQTAAGVELFSLSFDMSTDADGGGTKSFLFALPVQSEWSDALATIALSGPEGRVSIDQSGELSMALLFEETSGKLRGVLRDQPAELAADAKSGLVAKPGLVEPGLRVLVSRGVPEHPK